MTLLGPVTISQVLDGAKSASGGPEARLENQPGENALKIVGWDTEA